MSDILHYYLDLLRGENEDRFGFHNVLNVMKQSRGGYVLNESFDGINLRNEPLVNIHFSDDNGQKASSFCGCKVSRNCFLSGHSAPIESMEFIDDNTLVSRSANEVITWDIHSGLLINTDYYKLNTDYYKYSVDMEDHNDFSLHDPGAHEMLKIGNYYVISNSAKKELIICDLENNSKPYRLRLPFFENISLDAIKDTQFLLVQESILLPFNYSDLKKILNKANNNSYIIDVESRRIVLEFKERINIPTYIPELNCLLIEYESDEIELYSVIDYSLIVKFDNIKPFHRSIAISKNKLYIAFSTSDFGIEIYSIKTGEHIKSCGGNTSTFKGYVSYDRSKMILYPSESHNYTCMFWNLEDKQIINRTNINYTTMMEFSPDGNSVIIHSQSDDSINFFDTKTGQCRFSIHSQQNQKEIMFSKYFPGYYGFRAIWWNYSGDFFFLTSRKLPILIYDNNGTYHGKVSIHSYDLCISENTVYIGYLGVEEINIFNRKTNQTEIMEQTCICILYVSDDGRYVTTVRDVDFDKAIIKTEVLDMKEKKVCSEEIIEKDYMLLNYIRQYDLEQQQQDIYKSDGWTIKIPSSPDNSTFITAYLVPNLYIGGCDFRGSTFDDETKEIIRQYNGIV